MKDTDASLCRRSVGVCSFLWLVTVGIYFDGIATVSFSNHRFAKATTVAQGILLNCVRGKRYTVPINIEQCGSVKKYALWCGDVFERGIFDICTVKVGTH